MKKETITIQKYIVHNKTEDEYIIYIIPDKDQTYPCTDFYIQKKDYGLISHIIGLEPKDFEQLDINTFIYDNLNEWIEICQSENRK